MVGAGHGVAVVVQDGLQGETRRNAPWGTFRCFENSSLFSMYFQKLRSVRKSCLSLSSRLRRHQEMKDKGEKGHGPWEKMAP